MLTLFLGSTHIWAAEAPVSFAQLLTERNFPNGITKSNWRYDWEGTFLIIAVILNTSCLLPSFTISLSPIQSVVSKSFRAIRSEIIIEFMSDNTFEAVVETIGNENILKKFSSAYIPFSENDLSPFNSVKLRFAILVRYSISGTFFINTPSSEADRGSFAKLSPLK